MTIRIVALGGTVNPGNTVERAMDVALAGPRAAGAHVEVFGGDYLSRLAHYRSAAYAQGEGAELVEAVRQAHGVLIAAPGYHGTISGLVKNGLDYLEDLSADARPYLDGRAVGLIATAYGDQATMSTLLTLRSIVHALRGWPTPMGATIRTHAGMFDAEGNIAEERALGQLELVGSQLLWGAQRFAGS